MKKLYFLFWGVIFGIVLIKSEVASWFRIYEMFQFDSFHMYGVIGSAVIFGILLTQIIKRMQIKSIDNKDLVFEDKDFLPKKYLIGGTIFGLGWALTGACPGPMFALLGAGYYAIIIPIIFAILGTLAYGLLKDKLPH
ncbi:YeeE/YedE thiosulfate transporter family protein [Flavobacteriaceae bacterium]|nr:YeeE/YedE thiosulfate transporter family protein [Flavobacteriaceae bacterium]